MIDALIIGHNEINFTDYVNNIINFGEEHECYRDLQYNFITYNNKHYNLIDAFNLCGELNDSRSEPILISESLSATIAYLVTFLHKHGYSFDYVNSFNVQKEELKYKLQKNKYKLIVVTTTLYFTPIPIYEVIEFIRSINSEVKIVVGGPFVALQHRTHTAEVFQSILKTIDADYFINSAQGEASLIKLLEHLHGNITVDEVSNLFYKKDDKFVSTFEIRERNKLEENIVNWGLVKDNMSKCATIRTVISCPFNCAFCGFPSHAGKYEAMPVNCLRKELDLLKKNPVVKYLHFIDDTMNFPPKRFKETLRMMIDNKYNYKWHCYFRSQFADEETVKLMKESGCDGVYLGLESGNDEILKLMKKNATLDDYRKGIELLKKYDISTFGSFIIGYPGETANTVQDTVNFINESKFDFYRVHLWYCWIVTPIWNDREKYKLEGQDYNWSHATMNSVEACDHIENIFKTVKSSVYIPSYNYNHNLILEMKERGLSMDEIKSFCQGFNEGVKERMNNRNRKEISTDLLNKMQGTLVKENIKDIDVGNTSVFGFNFN